MTLLFCKNINKADSFYKYFAINKADIIVSLSLLHNEWVKTKLALLILYLNNISYEIVSIYSVNTFGRYYIFLLKFYY